MNDDTPDIRIASIAGETSHEPQPGREAKPAKKKRSKGGAKTAAVPAAKPAGKSATAAIEARIGHQFADPNLLIAAITHVSALKPTRKRGESYQRLEFLGDHVLGLIVSDMLYRTFPSADEGEMSKRLADLVRKESCAEVAKSLGLTDDIKLGAVGAGAGARLRKSVLGDICEAVIGAVFLDGGYAAAADFVERNWTERMQPADPGLPGGRAHRAASRSAIPRRGGFAGARSGGRHRRQQARGREGRGLRDDRARRRRRRQQ